MPQQFIQQGKRDPDFSTMMQGLTDNLARRAKLQDRKNQQAATYEQMIARKELVLPKGANIKVTDEGLQFGDSAETDDKGNPIVSKQQAYEAWQRAQNPETDDLTRNGDGTTVTQELLPGDKMENMTAVAAENALAKLRSDPQAMRQNAFGNIALNESVNQNQEVRDDSAAALAKAQGIVKQGNPDGSTTATYTPATPAPQPSLPPGADPNDPKVLADFAAQVAIKAKEGGLNNPSVTMRQSTTTGNGVSNGGSGGRRSNVVFGEESPTVTVKGKDRTLTTTTVNPNFKDEIKETTGSLRRAALMESVNNMFGQGGSNIYAQAWRDREAQLDKFNATMAQKGKKQEISGGLTEVVANNGKYNFSLMDAMTGSTFMNVNAQGGAATAAGVREGNGNGQNPKTMEYEVFSPSGNVVRYPNGGVFNSNHPVGIQNSNGMGKENAPKIIKQKLESLGALDSGNPDVIEWLNGTEVDIQPVANDGTGKTRYVALNRKNPKEKLAQWTYDPQQATSFQWGVTFFRPAKASVVTEITGSVAGTAQKDRTTPYSH